MPRWTEETRRKQAAQARITRPWLKSTGPRTAAGKAKVARNPIRHGFRNAEMRELLHLLAVQRRWVADLERAKSTGCAARERFRASRLNRNRRRFLWKRLDNSSMTLL